MPPSGSALRFQHLLLPRQGHTADECQDAAAGDPERGRFAVADGASESAFAGEWARLLVEDWVRASDAPAWASWLPPLQARWAAAVDADLDREQPWYLEERLRLGAFATFLGLGVELTTEGGPAWRWRAVAVGDSCLFQVCHGDLALSFPLNRADEFGSTPRLIGSRSAPGEQPRPRSVAIGGSAEADDTLWLMTDALAQWFLRRVEAGERPWEELEPLLAGPDPDRAFAAWVEAQRDARRLRNDDVTVLAVCLD
jgi:hypothetical protein